MTNPPNRPADQLDHKGVGGAERGAAAPRPGSYEGGTGWWDEGESGPPTPADDIFLTAWAQEGYRPARRGDKPMEGQMKLGEVQ